MNKRTNTVFVGLSGGVDSSVAALRLQQAGYDVVGVFIKVWHPDFLPCNWEAERRDAMRVAAHLRIPFLTCDAETAYYESVAQYFIKEYEAGRTPNPDVMCNQHVKFGAFLEFARSHGVPYIATGHYAQRLEVDGGYELQRGVDINKDQSYFLWTLTQLQLGHTLLPVGSSTKVEIRQEAEQANLPTASKKDSQGICFLGQVDIYDFLKHFLPLEVGSVLNEKGEVVGEHKGAAVYTTGQRHGFTITTPTSAGKIYYVTTTDLIQNTITVNEERPHLEPQSTLHLEQLNLINVTLSVGSVVELQVRYRQNPITGTVTALSDTTMELQLQEAIDGGAAGQSCVLYWSERCLGGGIIR